MAAAPSIDLSGWLDDQLTQASPDLLRGMVKTFAGPLMGAEADAKRGPTGSAAAARSVRVLAPLAELSWHGGSAVGRSAGVAPAPNFGHDPLDGFSLTVSRV